MHSRRFRGSATSNSSRCRRGLRRNSSRASSARGEILDLGPELDDLADTAAVLEQLDLVIGVDTAVMHLAGALGVPAWMMVPAPCDWRWLDDRADSPWYPTLRIYRQAERNRWDDVIGRVAEDLAAWAGDASPRARRSRAPAARQRRAAAGRPPRTAARRRRARHGGRRRDALGHRPVPRGRRGSRVVAGAPGRMARAAGSRRPGPADAGIRRARGGGGRGRPRAGLRDAAQDRAGLRVRDALPASAAAAAEHRSQRSHERRRRRQRSRPAPPRPPPNPSTPWRSTDST